MRKKLLLHIFFVFLAVVAVWIIAGQNVEVFNKDDLRNLSCGWPLKFAVNDQSWRDPPFPWKISCLSGEWDYSFIKFFRWPQFIIDVIVFYALIIFFWNCVVNLLKRQISYGKLCGKWGKVEK
ncbi:hypothetical protein KKA09_00840 [Patescibacteria group bacterium]|nr:hypothetical protein [Patescibacteria group bacterium]